MSGLKGFFEWYHDNGILPNIWKGATGQLSQEKINNENLDYQRERNRIEDARYEDETNYNRSFAESEREFNRAFAINERAYNRAFAENEREYNRAFAAEEQAYNRAFAEDERNYQRDWALNERNYQRDWALNERDYQRNLQQQIFEREDTAIARQAEALRAQGINPLSQSLNGLGAGSVVSSSSPGSSSSGSSSPVSSSSGSSSLPSSTSYHSANAPSLSGRQGKALQKAMITSQGINGLLGPILQTMNTVDNLRGAGLQRDILNAQAMKTQAEANISIMNMLDTSNRLNLPKYSFTYGQGNKKSYSAEYDKGYNPYTYSPQLINQLEGDIKGYQTHISRFDSKVAQKQELRLDSIGDGMKYLTNKLSNKTGGDKKVLDSFAGILESLLLKAFK